MDPISNEQYSEVERWGILKCSDGDLLLVRTEMFKTAVYARFTGEDAQVRAIRVLWTIQEAVYDGFMPYSCVELFERIMSELGPVPYEEWCGYHGTPHLSWGKWQTGEYLP